MFYLTFCIFDNIVSQVPRLEAVEDVQRQHPDSAGHTQAALLHRQVSISAGAPQNNVPIWDILPQHPGLSSTHHQYPRAGLQILITSGNFNSPLSFAPGPDIYICRDGAISYNFSPRYYSRYSYLQRRGHVPTHPELHADWAAHAARHLRPVGPPAGGGKILRAYRWGNILC